MAFEKSHIPTAHSVVASRILISRTLLAVWGGGTTIYLLTLVFTPPPPSGMTADWLIVALGYSMFAGFLLCRRQLTTWAIDVNGYVGVFCASVVVAASGSPSTSYGLFYLWVTVLSCHFLPLRRALPQILLMPIGYLVALHAAGGQFPWVRWILLSATVAVVGFSVAFLRRQAERLLTTLVAQARTDALTGLLNRRAFEEDLDGEVARAHRTGQPLALIIADIDHFKVINDRWGHPAGDEVLQQVSEVLRDQCRRMDDAFRIGGEEFAVVVPGADANVAAVLAERIRHAVGTDLSCPGAPITLSLGIATYPAHADDSAALTAAADANCYRAKRQGRDRTILSPTGLPRQRTGRRRFTTVVGPASSAGLFDADPTRRCEELGIVESTAPRECVPPDNDVSDQNRTGRESTGLPNRAVFKQRLDRALAGSRRSGRTTAILLANVDNFEAVADTYGAEIGGEMLNAIGQRLTGLLRPGDMLARIGGDEFAILCENADDAAWLYSLAPRINSAMTETFVLSGVHIQTAVSVGIAVADNYDSPAPSADELLREAGAAMYCATGIARAANQLSGR
jgi:diguanylate cyclase (GGDEF)-like protein